MTNQVKRIQLDYLTGQVRCFMGSTELCSVDKIKLYPEISPDNDLENYIKTFSSVALAIEHIQHIARFSDGRGFHLH